jgi:hypothetical protein
MLAILNLVLPLSVASGNGTIAETNKAYPPSPSPASKKKALESPCLDACQESIVGL